MRKTVLVIAAGLLAIIVVSMWAIAATTPVVVTAQKIKGDPASPDDALWNTISAKAFPTSSNELNGGEGSNPNRPLPQINVKAVYNDEFLYMLAEWDDPTYDNLHSYWTFNGGVWSKTANPDVDEDRLYLMWPITDVPGRGGKTFAQAGCSITCHKIDAVNNLVPTPEESGNCGACHDNSGVQTAQYEHQWVTPADGCSTCHLNKVDRSANAVADHAAPTGGAFDIWHWKAGRASNIGFADDQYTKNTLGRRNDASPGLDSDNRNTAKTAPKYIWPLNAENSSSTGDLNNIVVKSGLVAGMSELSTDGLTLKDTTITIPNGTTVRAKIMNDVDAGAGMKDIQSQQTYGGGKHRIVLKRKLVSDDSTGNDYNFNLDGDNLFSIAVTDNSAINHTGSNGPHILRFGPPVFVPDQVWNSGPNNWNGQANKAVAGDFDGDGKDDIATFYGYQFERQTRAWVFTSATALNTSSMWWDSGPNNWDWEGSKLVAGDFNGDGLDDIAVLYGYAATRQARVWIFISEGNGFKTPSMWWDSGPNNWDWEGTNLLSGDFDNDGKDELAAFYTYGGQQSAIFILQY